MADTIVSLLETGKSCFIVIGAGHFVGEENLREILTRKGYPTRQMTR